MEDTIPLFNLFRSSAISLSNDATYVLQFSIQDTGCDADLFAIGVSGLYDVKVYHASTFLSIASLQGHESAISGLAFDKSNAQLIWSSSFDGTLRCWDLRSRPFKAILQLKGNDSALGVVPLTSMDVSIDGTLCCAGTELQEELEVSVYLWDVRQVKENGLHSLLTKYEDSHSDDITQVKFHPQSANILATGSTDGLVSLFDVTKTDEEEALQRTLNTESSVSKIGFFGSKGDYMYSTTHIETLQFWDTQEGERLGGVDNIKGYAMDSYEIDYIIDCFYHEESERLFVAAGTHSGHVELLHSTLENVEPFQTLSTGHKATVRTACYLNKPRILYTGDEGGVICSWASSHVIGDNQKTKPKTRKSGKGKVSKKPYREEKRKTSQ